jgi:hypothetical protein
MRDFKSVEYVSDLGSMSCVKRVKAPTMGAKRENQASLSGQCTLKQKPENSREFFTGFY